MRPNGKVNSPPAQKQGPFLDAKMVPKFLYSSYVQSIFSCDCFYCMWTWIYRYAYIRASKDVADHKLPWYVVCRRWCPALRDQIPAGNTFWWNIPFFYIFFFSLYIHTLPWLRCSFFVLWAIFAKFYFALF